MTGNKLYRWRVTVCGLRGARNVTSYVTFNSEEYAETARTLEIVFNFFCAFCLCDFPRWSSVLLFREKWLVLNLYNAERWEPIFAISRVRRRWPSERVERTRARVMANEICVKWERETQIFQPRLGGTGPRWGSRSLFASVDRDRWLKRFSSMDYKKSRSIARNDIVNISLLDVPPAPSSLEPHPRV